MKADKILDSLNIMVNVIVMKEDYMHTLEPDAGPSRVLLVEGQTDHRFMVGYLCDGIRCEVVGKAQGCRSRLTSNSKGDIVNVIYGLASAPLLQIPEAYRDVIVYGMVDMDADGVDRHADVGNLFVTDTHDLETLMLSTDKELLQRILGCEIPQKDIHKALFMAYQMGIIRQILHNLDMPWPLSAGEADYSSFVGGDYRISVQRLVSYLKQRVRDATKLDDDPFAIGYTQINVERQQATEECKKLNYSKVENDKRARKYLDKEGCWKSPLETFDPTSKPDLWMVINGHEFLSLLRYVNEDVAIQFEDRSEQHLNRNFEMALIDAYDQGRFRTTRIYERMAAAHVVRRPSESATYL